MPPGHVRRTTGSFNTTKTTALADRLDGLRFRLAPPGASNAGSGMAHPGPISADKYDMGKRTQSPNLRSSQAGVSMIETLMAAGVLVIGSIAMLTLIVTAIAMNNRNKIDSTQTMLAESILEQVNS